MEVCRPMDAQEVAGNSLVLPGCAVQFVEQAFSHSPQEEETSSRNPQGRRHGVLQSHGGFAEAAVLTPGFVASPTNQEP